MSYDVLDDPHLHGGVVAGVLQVVTASVQGPVSGSVQFGMRPVVRQARVRSSRPFWGNQADSAPSVVASVVQQSDAGPLVFRRAVSAQNSRITHVVISAFCKRRKRHVNLKFKFVGVFTEFLARYCDDFLALLVGLFQEVDESPRVSRPGS